ncbi:MAG: hypothetical protein PHS95_00680 [Candidatus Pacebacteria bacterium]|nr:hypothetical protein [Candidatus Paceibacterota bacterium]
MNYLPIFAKSLPLLRRFVWWILSIFILVVLAILTTSFIVNIKTKAYIYSDINSIPRAQTVLIPGAAILYSGELSPILRDRANAATLLYNSGKVTKILVSGDNSTLAHNEVNPVREYLLK